MTLWFLMSISKGLPGASSPRVLPLGYPEASGNRPGGGLEGAEGRKAFLTLPTLTQDSLVCSAQGFSQFGQDQAFRQ